MSGSSAKLELQRVTVRFAGLVALDGVSLTAPKGRVTGVIGPNGAGQDDPVQRRVRVRPAAVGGGALARPGARRHRPHDLTRLGIARTLQGLGLFPGLTVLENVMVGADPHARTGFFSGLFALPRADRDEAALRERALARLAELGVEGEAGRLPGQLPYGVQKRVALARALVAEPDLLLLDEPAAGLSAAEMDELAGLIRGLRGGPAVVLVEHHMDLVMNVCDQVVVLDFGKVIASGAPAEVRDDPAVLDAYLGEEVRGA
ncbi:ATP-binding cassette domain-containing protein [Actinomadura madurae]|uniref:ABC transporter ATP-binding protein n=1 Tax=Actinomadura madurae TaxID=1993 RepID=UPI0020D2123E|nr:ATP-binding cassette domain-containing protein [Actinomadura madurae]MCP9963875.1 ATP-binding cassette domain-containing protein [Actinomadura madurae]